MRVIDWGALVKQADPSAGRNPAYVFDNRVFLEQPTEYQDYDMGIGVWAIGSTFKIGPLEDIDA